MHFVSDTLRRLYPISNYVCGDIHGGPATVVPLSVIQPICCFVPSRFPHVPTSFRPPALLTQALILRPSAHGRQGHPLALAYKREYPHAVVMAVAHAQVRSPSCPSPETRARPVARTHIDFLVDLARVEARRLSPDGTKPSLTADQSAQCQTFSSVRLGLRHGAQGLSPSYSGQAVLHLFAIYCSISLEMIDGADGPRYCAPCVRSIELCISGPSATSYSHEHLRDISV
ncbi:hypothetical protein DAEQUDRAFT_173183 [Daedalea quercina L-15889]|uniref:Uncharacterized protein n=1 Tax=Daedalea quercina L-15889 TaxID=1314783 RepID=A0A165RBS9_9APHY|nr:hypothetical protein DAEQUDRAFT_173183 [Daedalea quercina L-15889]